MKNTLFLFLTITLLFGCNSTDATKEQSLVKKDTAKVEIPKDTIPEVVATPTFNTNNRFNNITAILSGYKGKANNLNYLFDTVIWNNHSKGVQSRPCAAKEKTSLNWTPF